MIYILAYVLIDGIMIPYNGTRDLKSGKKYGFLEQKDNFNTVKMPFHSVGCPVHLGLDAGCV